MKKILIFVWFLFIFLNLGNNICNASSYLYIDSHTTPQDIAKKIDNGADVDKKIDGNPPLIQLIKTKSLADDEKIKFMVKQLIDAGADVNATDKYGRTFLMVYLIKCTKNEWCDYNILDSLMENSNMSIKDNFGKSALYYSMYCDEETGDIHSYIHNTLCSVDGPTNEREGKYGYVAEENIFIPSVGSRSSRSDLIKKILDKGGKIETKEIAEGLLCAAIDNKDFDQADQMVEYISDINKVNCLRSKGVTNPRSFEGDLFNFASTSSMEAIKWVQGKLSAQSKVDNSPALWQNFKCALETLNADYELPENKYFLMLNYLLENGANIDKVFSPNRDYGDYSTYTMLSYVAQKFKLDPRPRFFEMIKYLIAKGARLTFSVEKSYLGERYERFICFVYKDNDLLALALEHGSDPNIPCVFGEYWESVIHYTDAEGTELLIKYGADVNDRGIYKSGAGSFELNTVLCDAIEQHDEEKIIVLLENGADPNKPCKNGYPLQYSLSPTIESLLIEYGAKME